MPAKKTVRKPKNKPRKVVKIRHDGDHHGCESCSGAIPNWRPPALPPQVPLGHEDAEDRLEKLILSYGWPKSVKPPTTRPKPPTDPSEKFRAFVYDVVELLRIYNQVLDNWRHAQHECAEAKKRGSVREIEDAEKACAKALANYRKFVDVFNDYVDKSALVDTSRLGEFMLEVVQVNGFVTNVRILAHPVSMKAQGDAEILYSHSKSYVWLIKPPQITG